ncbi:MAG: TIGR03564 family F420-dependent LLM class oxidoreductase [Acidimicrobiales bacterium]
MRIGIFAGDVTGARPLAELIEGAIAAEADGFASYWLPWIAGHDPLAVFALAGRDTSRVELGTAVLRTYPRHPADLASAAITTAVATGGRFTLGVGPSHKRVIVDSFGYDYRTPVRHTREYLTVLNGLLQHSKSVFVGEEITARFALRHPDRDGLEVPVVLSALGPKMLEVAGALADGTFTWMTGPVTLQGHTVPALAAAAAAAERATPRVIAGAPCLVTDDPDGGRALAALVFELYGALPSYRAMLDREGWATPAHAAVVGNEAAVTAELARYRNAGVTDFAAVEFDTKPTASRRTRDLLASLNT